MMDLFLSVEEATRILSIIKNDWMCFEQLESYLLGEFGEKAVFIMMALRRVMREEKPVDEEIHRAWLEYTGGEPIRLSELRKKVKEFCKKHGFEEKKFWEWWDGKTRLIICDEVNAEKILRITNYYVLRHILRMSSEVVMFFPRELEGKIIKEAKLRAIHTDATIEYETKNNTLRVRIIPSQKTLETFTGLGEHATKMIARTLEKEIVLEKIPISGPEWEEYDSIVEKTLAYYLELHGAKVKREPVAIKLGDLVFIPDLQVTYKNKSVLVEIVGYWRKKYIIDKEVKIRRALKKGTRIIIVANPTTAKHLRHLDTLILQYKNIKDLETIATEIIAILYENTKT